MPDIFDTLEQTQPQAAAQPQTDVFDRISAPSLSASMRAPTGDVFDRIAPTAAPATAQPKPQATGIVGRAWDWLNEPLATGRDVFAELVPGGGQIHDYLDEMDKAVKGAPPSDLKTAYNALRGANQGFDQFLAGMTSPLSLGLAVSSFGGSLVEGGLTKAGMSAIKAAGLVRKVKTLADFGFLGKYSYDLGSNTLPQLEMSWGDYRSATNDHDRQKALDKFSTEATSSILNAIAMGFAAHGLATDRHELEFNSPKGKAMQQEHYANAVYDFQEENQTGVAQARQTFEKYRKEIPEDRQIAISHNIEHGGDPALLEAEAQRQEADPRTKANAKEYRDAMHLSDKEIEARDYLRTLLAGDLAHLKYLGLMPEDGGLPNYLPHKVDVEDVDPETGKTVARTLQDGDGDMLKKRVFPTIGAAERSGVKMTTKAAVPLIADYHERVSNLIAKTNLAEKLAGSYTNDGAPMAAPGHLFPGYTRPMDAPLSPQEVENLQTAGKFDQLLHSGRIYEVPVKPPKPSTETAIVPAERAIVPKNARELGGEEEQHAYMWKQSDYVPSGLSVWRPIKEGEAAELPNAITTWGNGPVPEQAIIPAGEKGIPTDPHAPPEPIPHKRVPVYVAPEVAPHLNAMLESTTPKNALIKAILKASSEAKSDLLALSPFHWNTILNRTLEAGMNPFKGTNRKFLFMPKDIDYYNLTPAQTRAIHAGVVVSSTRPGFSGYLDEGLASGEDSFINKIPLIGDFNKAIEGRLFGPHGWISSLKFDLFDKLSGEIQKSRPELTGEQADRIAASQVNNKFGGLNYSVLGRGAQTQNTLRGLLLAPDFLESTGRSILDVAGGHGGSLIKGLVAYNAASWLMARGINYLVSGDTRPQTGLSVLSKDGKREYSLRSTLGDFLHFAEKPKEFLANRENPLAVRLPGEIIAGEDEYGHKVTDTQEFFDALRQITPIPLQGLYPTQQVSQASPTDKLLQSGGVQSHKKFSPAETKAQELMTKHSGEGAPLQGDELAKAQLRFKLEDALRNAINSRDVQGRVKAQQAIHAASTGPER